MDSTHERSPHDRIVALASGASGLETVRELGRAQVSKHRLLLEGVVAEAEEAGHQESALARTGWDLLAAALADDPAAEVAVRQPSVGAWAMRTILACRGKPAMPGASPGSLRAIAAAAAIRCGRTAEIEVAATKGLVVLPSLGAACSAGDTAVVRVAQGRASVGPVEIPADPHQDAVGWLGLRRVRHHGFDVLIDDLDPFRMPTVSDLAARGPGDSWESALRQAWDVLDEAHPVVAAEAAAAISVIVPRVGRATGAVSSSARECFGAVAMSLPPDPVSGAETFAHEVQHVKLGALLDQVPLTKPDDGKRYYAPWREDPRPLSALLQGTYAYLGVTGFWRRQRRLEGYQEQGEARYARWRAAAAMAVETLLASEGLTADGVDFASGMAQTLRAWQHEPVTPRALDSALRAVQDHVRRWESAHGRRHR